MTHPIERAAPPRHRSNIEITMRHLIRASALSLLLAGSIALPNGAMAEAQFRMQIPSVIIGIGSGNDDDTPPDNGTSSLIEVYADDSGGRALGAISIPVTIAGATGTETVTLDEPGGAIWIPDGTGGGTISWPSAAVGTHEITICVADADGAPKATKTISIVVHDALTASVPQSNYLPKVGDALAIAPTVQNLIAGPGSARWGASPELPTWMSMDDTSGELAVDTTAAHVATEFELTAVDQTDLASASTAPFSVGVAPIISLSSAALPDAKEAIAYAGFDLSSLATVTGTDKSDMSWSATGLPDGLSLDASTGVLEGAPTEKGDYDFAVIASKMGGDGQQTYTIKVGGAYLTGVTQISAGFNITCAVANGGAWCWGTGGNGKLGNGTNVSSSIPVQVSGLSSGVTQIAAGTNHACAIQDGAARCWGMNDSNQLGDGTTTTRTTPVQVSGLTNGVTQISTGSTHTCAIVSGSAKCWGWNNNGQLGNNTTTTSNVPVQVSGLTSEVTQISAGNNYSCAIQAGAAKCWGTGSYGDLGDGTQTQRLTPVQVSGLNSGVTWISASSSFTTCAVISKAAKCWGYNDKGQIGDGTTTNRLTPVQVTGLGSSVTQIQTSSSTTCATVSGTARCWGHNAFGQIGDGTTTGRLTSVQVSGMGLNTGTTQIVTGSGNTCALASGEVWCWGTGSGANGDGTYLQRLTPVQVLAP
jgi:alpha-tubulin suppressor-like RCC1 family protein